MKRIKFVHSSVLAYENLLLYCFFHMSETIFKIIKTYDLGFFFLTLYKAKRDIGPLDNHKEGCYQQRPLQQSSNQVFIIFVGGIYKQSLLGTKTEIFSFSFTLLNPDTLPDDRIWLFGFSTYTTQLLSHLLKGI